MQSIHLGTIGWSYSFWKGKFYPQKTLAKDYLAYYSTQFNTVEADSTFYESQQLRQSSIGKNKPQKTFSSH